MKIREIADLLHATVYTEDAEQTEREVEAAFASDMMSDVLAFAEEGCVLVSGLLNPQVIRTAHMLDMPCIVFVRGKVPTAEILSLAEESHIAVMRTEYGMFTTCGTLYKAGLH